MTQLEAAKQGIITEEMRQVAEDEHIDAEKIREGVEAGHIVIPANKNHRSLHAYGIGEGLRTKMNVNLGVSKDCHDYSVEQEKARLAWRMKVEAIMDLSCYGKTAGFRHWLIENSPAAIGTVPMYDVDGALGKALKDMTADDLFQVV